MDWSVVISLPRRSDRLSEFMQSPGVRVDWPLPPLQVWPGVDGVEEGRDGHWGCRESHLRLWERALDEGVETLWVFEDDAVIDHTFFWRVRGMQAAVPSNWEAIWLGGVHLLEPLPVTYGVVRCVWPVESHAYALRGQAVMKAAVRGVRRRSSHLDYDLGQVVAERGRTYAPNPMIVKQSGSPGDIRH